MRFAASPEILRSEGQKLINLSNSFSSNTTAIYNSVNKMVTTDYLSPEAKVIAAKINTYKEDLNLMIKTINEYGTLCLRTGNKVDENQENLTSGIQGVN